MISKDGIDLLEAAGNQIGTTGLAALLIEYGISRWTGRVFSKKKVWIIFVVILGIKFAYRAILIRHAV